MLRFPRRASLLALLVVCLFFYGCAAAPAQETGAGGDATPAPAQPSPVPSPTPRTGNPVWLFYDDFYSAAQEQLDGLHAALAQSSDPTAIDGELILSALEERLTEGMISFGLLMHEDDGQGYASTVEGAALGSGTINGKNGLYDLAFAYTEGSVTLSGALTPYRLRYSRQVPEQEVPAYSLLLLHAKEGWAAVLDLGGGPAYVLRCGEAELGLYAIAYGASAASGPITYSNCAEGAVQSWVYAKGELTMEGQGDNP